MGVLSVVGSAVVGVLSVVELVVMEVSGAVDAA